MWLKLLLLTIASVAGSDTTATGIRATLLFVLTNVRVYQSLQAEIDAFNPRGPVITEDEAKSLPYLQAVIVSRATSLVLNMQEADIRF